MSDTHVGGHVATTLRAFESLPVQLRLARQAVAGSLGEKPPPVLIEKLSHPERAVVRPQRKRTRRPIWPDSTHGTESGQG